MPQESVLGFGFSHFFVEKCFVKFEHDVLFFTFGLGGMAVQWFFISDVAPVNHHI